MSIIGDLIFMLRGDPKQLNVDVAKAGDKAGQTFGQRMSAGFKKSWSGGEIGKGLVQGLGLAGGLGAARLFAGAISKVGDVLGDATQAALAEEVSIQKLGTALKANIPNWNGQTDAIESVLKARMKLGFSDDEQRESLALLVVATKDATKALAIQRVAMDLARLKGISLKEASEALIKVEAGQFRALKALGIQLPKNATATEALAAVQKAATGQAEDYAKTNAGKLLVSQVKIGEAMEKLGEKILPVLTDATMAAADAVTFLSNVFDILNGKLPKTQAEGEETLELMLRLTEAMALVSPAAAGMAEEIRNAMADAAKSSDTAANAASSFEGRVAESFGEAEVSMGDLADASGEMAGDIKDDNRSVITSWAELRKALRDDADDMIGNVFDPIEAKNRLFAANAEAAAARRVIASKTATNAEKRDAKDALDSVARDTASLLTELAAAGMSGSQTFKTGLASLEAYAATTSGKTREELMKVIATIKQVKREGKYVPINIQVNRRGNIGSSGARAEGGPVTAGHAYLVNENTARSELWVPSVSGMVYPTAASVPASAMAGGGGDTFHVHTYGMPGYASTPGETVAAWRRAARIGAIKPPRKPPGWS